MKFNKLRITVSVIIASLSLLNIAAASRPPSPEGEELPPTTDSNQPTVNACEGKKIEDFACGNFNYNPTRCRDRYFHNPIYNVYQQCDYNAGSGICQNTGDKCSR